MNRTTPKYLGLKVVIEDSSYLMMALNLSYWSGYDVMVDWGDGTTEKLTCSCLPGANADYDHTYSATGTYKIKIFSTGNVIPAINEGYEYQYENITFVGHFRECLTEVFNATIPFATARWNFNYCPNLTRFDWSLFEYTTTLENRTYFEQSFGLTGVIPNYCFIHIRGNAGRLFLSQNQLTGSTFVTSGVTNIDYLCANSGVTIGGDMPSTVTSMESTFSGNTHITSVYSFPPNVTNVANCYAQCSNATGSFPTIPNTVTNMAGLFMWCGGLGGTVPAFPTNVTDVAYAYAGTGASGTIPAFATTITNMYGVFSNCSGMTGTIPTLPTYVTDIGEAFQGCTGLSGSIPTLPNTIISIAYAFNGCTGLRGTIPTLPTSLVYMGGAFMYVPVTGSIPTIPGTVVDMSNSFYYCTSLTGSIPTLPSNVENLNGTFLGCSGLTGSTPAIPSTVYDMRYTFYDCTGLDGTIGTIDTNIASEFNRTFYNCSNLTGNAPALWDTTLYPNVTQPDPGNSNQCFYGCTSLSNYNDIPADWK